MAAATRRTSHPASRTGAEVGEVGPRLYSVGPSETLGQESLESLSSHWRGALDAADRALDAATHQLGATDVAVRRSQLRTERDATARLLDQVGQLHGTGDAYVSLMIPRSKLKGLLGIPADVEGFVFDLEGVLIGSAVAHEAAWSQTFDDFIHARIERTHGGFTPFNPRIDYARFMQGKPRLDGVRAFLASRGIRLPEGLPQDDWRLETVHGLANRKQRALIRYLEEHGVTAFGGARRYLCLAHEVGVRSGVVSASANTRAILHKAGISRLVDVIVDGSTFAGEHGTGALAPDSLLYACEELAVEPACAAVFETRAADVAAARAAGFGFIVGVARTDQARLLSSAGADMVVADLLDLLERRLSRLISRRTA